ncbi:hypothetical protein [Mucilaginibacter sp.]|uniref:hypothetical protein n=1 Tax=Mucilaginibacter sp. TaxID=1882438 RepID=UPI0026133B29|nr:hypothetical protein [Mucilaginibacter sp.]
MIRKHIKRKFKLQLPVDNIHGAGLETIFFDKPMDKKTFDNKDAAFVINDEGNDILKFNYLALIIWKH